MIGLRRSPQAGFVGDDMRFVLADISYFLIHRIFRMLPLPLKSVLRIPQIDQPGNV